MKKYDEKLKILGMDIETYEKKGDVIPYLFVLMDDKFSFHYVYESEKEGFDIIFAFLSKIDKIVKGDEVEIYTHNIQFDGYILISYFLKKSIPFKWFIRNLDLYTLQITFKGMIIKFRCSYKLLNMSISKLGLLINHRKTTFPYKFVEKKTLFYSGEVPNFEFFESKEDY